MSDDRPEFLQRFFPLPDEHRATPDTRRLTPDQAKPYAAEAMRRELETLARAPEGTRNDSLNVAGFNLAQLCAGGYLDHQQVWDALHTTARMIGLSEAETTATLHSAFQAGDRHPRVVAELDADVPPPVTVFTPPDPPREGDAEPAEDTAPDIAAMFPRVDWHKLWADETEDEWLVKPLLPARRLVALFSPPKVGKSLLMLEIACEVSRGEPVLGERVDKSHRVLYVDFENDPRGDIRSRLQAMGRKPGDLENLVYLSFPQLAHLDTYMGGLQLMAVVDHYGVELVVIDTISRAVGGEENDNDTWLGFYRNTGLLLKAAGVACIRLDHTGKDETKGMRGGSAKYGDVDAVWGMSKLTEDTFRLECTANRLPIAEKVLVLERRATPALHHAVTTKSTGAVRADDTTRHLAEMDRLKLPNDTGRSIAMTALRESGFPGLVEQRVREAIAIRKERFNA